MTIGHISDILMTHQLLERAIDSVEEALEHVLELHKDERSAEMQIALNGSIVYLKQAMADFKLKEGITD